MKGKVSGGRLIGKSAAVIMAIILAAVLVLSAYIGGQDKTMQKYCAALAMGSYGDYEATWGGSENNHSDKDGFKTECRGMFKSLPEFSELSDTDSISSKVRIKERRMNGSYDKWLCTADVDFFSSGKSVSYDDTVFELCRVDGKWLISAVNTTSENSVLTISL